MKGFQFLQVSLLTLSSFLGSFEANAALRLAIDNTSVTDSLVRIQGQLDESRAVVEVKHLDSAASPQVEAVPIQDQNIDLKLYLRDGGGRYRITVFGLHESDSSVSTSRQTFEVTNLDPRPMALKPQETSTRNSRVKISGRLFPGTRLVWLETLKVGGTKPTVENYLVNEERFSGSLYLRHGPGQYRIRIFVRKNDDSNLTFFQELEIRNEDSQNRAFELPSAAAQSEHPEIMSLARSLTAHHKDDFAKSQAIYRWITENIDYDAAAFFSSSYLNDPNDALTTLRTRKSVCQGYSALSVALHRSAGISARIVYGVANGGPVAAQPGPGNDGINHAWNEAYIDGRWVVHDNVWGAGHVDFERRIFIREPSLRYFDPSADSFSQTHRKVTEDQNS